MKNNPKWTTQTVVLPDQKMRLKRIWIEANHDYQYFIESFNGWYVEIPLLLGSRLWEDTILALNITDEEWMHG